ncbi:MAG: ABC transporter substrate-binding protein, partial [Pseudomonadota bacterium]
MSLSRNRISAIKISLLLAVCVFLVIGGLSQSAGAQEKKPFKIGFIAPMSGFAASYGGDMEVGAKIALEELNYTIAGRKVEFIMEDDSNDPAKTTIKARKLITHDKIDVLTGVVVASASYAIAPIMEEAKIPFVNALSAADDLTQRKRSKNMIRLWLTSCQIGHPAGDYAYTKLGWRKADTVGWEHSFGQEVLGSFQRVFEDAGGKVIQ